MEKDDFKDALKRHGFTYKEFAEKCEVSFHSVKAWAAHGKYAVPGYICLIIEQMDEIAELKSRK